MGLDTSQPCKKWEGRQVTGRQYGYIYVNRVRWYAHRLIFFINNGYLPPVVRHTCDHEWCVEPAHLIPGTQADNIRDAIERGRARKAIGEDASKAKLTEDQVLVIRSELNKGVSPAELARRYNVDHKTIRQIRDRKSWRHI